MCKPTIRSHRGSEAADAAVAEPTKSFPEPSVPSRALDGSNPRLGFLAGWFPLHPSVAVVMMAIALPSWVYMNRGFTVWFHIACFLHLLTQSRFLAKLLALSGVSICLGWYASLVWEFAYHGRWCHCLYKNMPLVLIRQMVDTNTTVYDNEALRGMAPDFESKSSLLAMAICHTLDVLFHPVLAHYFWKRCRNRTATPEEDSKDGVTAAKSTADDDDGLFSWPVILASYAFSRSWSLVHACYNHGVPAWFYTGHDVYVMDDLDMWYPAYVMETLFYAAIVLRKLWTK